MPVTAVIKTRRILKMLALAFLAVGLVGVVSFLSSDHGARLALENYTPVEAASLYSAMPGAGEAAASSIGEVKAILQPFNEIERRYDLPIVQSDSPQECVDAFASGRVMDCHGMALSAIERLRTYEIRSRLWYLTGTDGFGGNGHNVIEYYNTAAQRWEMLDPNYSAYVVRKNEETVLSVGELREALLTASNDLEVRYYGSSVTLRTPESLLGEYRSLLPSASVLATEDHRERYQHRYAFLMPLSGTIDQLPLSARRGVRALLMGDNDTKLLIADRYTPEYHLTLFKMLWYLSITMLVLGCVFAIAWLVTSIRRTSVIAPDTPETGKRISVGSIRNGMI